MQLIHTAMQRFLAIVCCAVLATALAHTTASGCEEYCSGVKIFNCTDLDYKVAFELCCPTHEQITQYYPVPVGCNGAARFNFYPCKIVGVVFSGLPPGVCYYWDPYECYITIYYCD